MKLRTLFHHDRLVDEIKGGYIRANWHESGRYIIYNYTEKTQYEQRWNTVTRNCRGLIVDIDDNVVARPWPKFFNVGEHDGHRHAAIPLDSPCRTVDKVDGSLLIVTGTPDGPLCATRGSFHSPQAEWATRWLRDNHPDWEPRPHVTYLFEIVYPENRIVVNYDYEGLVLLGCHDTETYTERVDSTWEGRRADVLPPRTLREALEMPDRNNAEGVVCTIGRGASRTMVKIKQAGYIEQHRLVTGISVKHIWEHLASGSTIDTLIEQLPDELHKWAGTRAAQLEQAYTEIDDTVCDDWLAIPGAVDMDRAEYARHAKESTYPAIMFRLYDSKPFDDIIWGLLKPKGDTRMISNG